MAKTITLRLDDTVYNLFHEAAVEDNRSISNLIETLALRKLKEGYYADESEMKEILSDKSLLKKLKTGHSDARHRKGRMIG
ncbi:MAG: CopG family transcriptional regulator [bacterium]|nr:CopG family transcriptional regulator [bacterium]